MAPSTRTQPRSNARLLATSPGAPDPSGFIGRHAILAGLFLVLLTVALYSPVHNHPFVNYDDDVYVTLNDHVKAGVSWSTIAWAFTTYDAANWHPLTWLSHATDYELFGGNPSGHHDHNLLLHAVNVALLFWILAQATGYPGRSWMVAALFALHPINVETVAWIAERKNLLSMMCFLLALGAYHWYATTPSTGTPKADNQRRLLRYLAVILLYALAVMAKPQVITFPFVLLLWDYWPLGRQNWVPQVWRFPDLGTHRAASITQVSNTAKPGCEWRSLSFLLLEKVPFFLMSAASALLTVAAQRKGGGFNPDYTLFTRCENAVVSYARYIGKAFWPSHLALLYPHPGMSLPVWQAGLSLLVLILVSALVLWQRDRRYLLVGWLWFLGTLVPMIGIVQVGRQALADRYAYLPFIGLFIMVCWGVADLAASRHVPSRWIAVSACIVLLVLAVLTHRQIEYWNDNVTVWAHTAQVTKDNFQAEDNWGESLQKAGKYDEAWPHYVRAAEINPSYPPAVMFLAVHDQREGDLPAAIAKYQQVIRATDSASYQNAAMRGMAFANLGHAYRELGDLTEARSSLEQSVQLNSKFFQAWMDLGVVSQRLGDPAEAAHAYEAAMEIQPYDVGYLLLARALEQIGKKEEAEAALRKGKLLTNNYEHAQQAANKLLAEAPGH